jgi:hypothetical protein
VSLSEKSLLCGDARATSKVGKNPPHSLVEKTAESRFPKKGKSKVGSHRFFLSFQKATSFI